MTGSETIVLVIADTAQRARCFAALANQPQRIVRGFANADDAASALDSCDSGCLVIDPRGLVPGVLGSLLRAAAQHPALVTLLLADRLDGNDALALVRAHPSDILPTASDADAIADWIARFMPLAKHRGALWLEQSTATRALARLSPRERDVLAALAEGSTSKDIARTLAVSPRTVEVHRASIMRRTGAVTLAELLRLYFVAALASTPGSQAAPTPMVAQAA